MDKKFIPISMFGCSFVMESDTTLIKIFVKRTNYIVAIRINEFKKHERNLVPAVEVLLGRLPCEVEKFLKLTARSIIDVSERFHE